MERQFLMAHVTMLAASGVIGHYAQSIELGFGIFGLGIALLAGIRGIAEALKR